MTLMKKSMSLGWALGALIVLASANPHEALSIPGGFNVQGRLTNDQGINRNGLFAIEFSVFDSAQGGTLLWKKTFDGTTFNQINVRNGQFQINLGDPPDADSQNQSLSPVFAGNDALYLQITVESEPPLVPRQQLVSVPFALRAAVADTVTVSPLPSGAIMMFESTSCPPGFGEVVGLRNRFPIGVDLDDFDPEIPAGVGVSGGGGGHAHTFSRGGHSGNTSGSPLFTSVTTIFPTVPPRPQFLTVLFCRKL